MLLQEPAVAINQRNQQGRTPLWIACRHGKIEVVKVLLGYQPQDNGTPLDVNQQSNNGYTPLDAALQRSQVQVIRLLFKDQRVVDNIKKLKRADYAFYIACEYGHVKVAELLLKHGAAIHQPGKDGKTPLQVAQEKLKQKSGYRAAYQAIVEMIQEHQRSLVDQVLAVKSESKVAEEVTKAKKEVEELLRNPQLDVNLMVEAYEMPLLYRACQQNKSKLVAWLVEDKRININQQNKHGSTPLFIACSQENKSIINCFLKQDGIAVNLANRLKKTPLLISCERDKSVSVKLLLNFTPQGNQQPLEVNQPRRHGATPLHVASEYGHARIVTMLLADQRVEVNAVNNSGETPLFIACSYGHWNIVNTLIQDKRTNRLLFPKGKESPYQIIIDAKEKATSSQDSKTAATLDEILKLFPNKQDEQTK